ncbi:hypothetical protein [Streptomyces gossypiisoli]|uniref:hypothetical protein n=1 Tax=Streptomyces gossypiisoli TaxID=2748864 RepID=UPI0015DA3501|nr:hypothetical protein [Streptomyces gossypiisoli]
MELTTLDERSREWQGEGGSVEWALAWDRTRDLIGTRLNYFSEQDTDGSTADGVAGLATALYITAREQRIDPSAVSRQAVDDLIRRREGETDLDIARRWETHLENLGHDIADSSDPVSSRWRVLRVNHDPDDRFWEDTTFRRGPAVLEGLSYVLSPRVALAF